MKYNFKDEKLRNKEVVQATQIETYSKIRFEFEDGTTKTGLVPVINGIPNLDNMIEV